MMQVSRSALIAAAGFLIVLPANAAQYVYPLRGQAPDKQASDEADCSRLAAAQLGLDPGARATFQPDGAPTGASGDASASAPVLGALPGNGLQGGPAGALGGGGPGEAGAATNALVSNAGGGAGAEGAAGGPAAARAGGPTGFDTARAACLTARGYSVH